MYIEHLLGNEINSDSNSATPLCNVDEHGSVSRSFWNLIQYIPDGFGTGV